MENSFFEKCFPFKTNFNYSDCSILELKMSQINSNNIIYLPSFNVTYVIFKTNLCFVTKSRSNQRCVELMS